MDLGAPFVLDKPFECSISMTQTLWATILILTQRELKTSIEEWSYGHSNDINHDDGDIANNDGLCQCQTMDQALRLRETENFRSYF